MEFNPPWHIPEDQHPDYQSVERYSRLHYDCVTELAFLNQSGAQSAFEEARVVADLGCGTGASTLFVSRTCPEAKIIAVDPTNQPFHEIFENLGDRVEFRQTPVNIFLTQEAQGPLDAVFIVKSSHAITTRDCSPLASLVNEGGYLLEVNGDQPLPQRLTKYFRPIWREDLPSSFNGLWQKIAE